MNKPSLLPSNATSQEQALEQATARLADTPIIIRDLWNADTCPAELLPWLAWSLSIDNWKDYWPESVKRLRIKAGVAIQRRKGSVASVRDAVASFGAALSLTEWFEMTPQGTPHTFAIVLSVGADVPATAEYQQDIIDEIARTKPERSHFTLTAAVSGTSGIGLQGAIRPSVYTRLATAEV
ncbi:MAG: phage tail protein I [Candidatus Reddybacter sp.]